MSMAEHLWDLSYQEEWMYCISCGRQMNDEERFCSQCGTRRAVIPTDADAGRVPAKPEQGPSVTPPASLRPIRSTAEIMPIRMAPAVAPTPVAPETAYVEPEESAPAYPTMALPAEESPNPASPSSRVAPVYSEPEPARPVATPTPAYNAAPKRTAESAASVAYAAVPFAAATDAADLGPSKRKISPVLIGAVIVALLAVGGIVWMLRSSMSVGANPPGKVEITMFPATAKVVAGKGVDFAATVTGAPTSEVTWKVEEGDDAGQIKTRGAYAKEGAISLYSTYTAPNTPGTYHLVATSTADTSKSASAEITVVAK